MLQLNEKKTRDIARRIGSDWVEDHYSPNNIEWVIEQIKKEEIVKSSKKINYYNIPCAFDIETTSFYRGVEKQAIMYCWTLSLNGYIIIGRYWSEFEDVLEMLEDRLGLSLQNRLIIYVHNLSFEFQFMRKHFSWDKVFSLSQAGPIVHMIFVFLMLTFLSKLNYNYYTIFF